MNWYKQPQLASCIVVVIALLGGFAIITVLNGPNDHITVYGLGSELNATDNDLNFTIPGSLIWRRRP